MKIKDLVQLMGKSIKEVTEQLKKEEVIDLNLTEK